jgi:hypothetical protein
VTAATTESTIFGSAAGTTAAGITMSARRSGIKHCAAQGERERCEYRKYFTMHNLLLLFLNFIDKLRLKP